MNIEKFIDGFGDGIYAFALICTKNFDSAASVFSRIAVKCEEYPDKTEFSELAALAFPLCRDAVCSDNAQTLSDLGLSKKQENLLAGFFQEPQVTRAFIHLYYENDLSEEEIAELTEEKTRYVSDRLSQLDERLTKALEADYKELCTLLTAPDELKEELIIAVKSGKHREFEITDDPMPRHTWTKPQKIAVIIFGIVFTVLVCIFIPIFNAYLDSYFNGGSLAEELPSDMIFSYDSNAEIPEE